MPEEKSKKTRMEIKEKIEQVEVLLKKMGSVLVAYSGGVDSTLVIEIARRTLGEKVLAVTAKSPLYSTEELKVAKAMAKKLKVAHLIIEGDELNIPGFVDNPKNRCYLCKKELFEKLFQIAAKYKLSYVLDGSNVSDISDFRPGRQAAKELGVCSPLEEVGLTKDEVRQVSKMMGLSTYHKPSSACLASRFPYGKQISFETLKMVEKAEEYLRRLGIWQVRVRHYENLCRIEVERQDLPILLAKQGRIVDKFKKLGYIYVTLDLAGYRSGSMNEE
ncbi:MAG: ATP-dependent sacrificial sulfur transferase LarE [bacterium]